MTRLPLYRRIANDIREKIHNGEYPVNEALPTEAQLREVFSVSRVTVRQALKLLIENNELESIQGSGTYVKAPKVNYDIDQQSSFAEKWTHLKGVTHSEVLAFEIQQASITLAEQLNLTEGEKIFYVKRVRFLDATPITVEETWLPAEMFPDLTYQVMKGSKYEFIEQHKGLIIDRSEQELLPVLPDPAIAALLQIDAGRPIIEKRTRGYLQGDIVFEYSRNYFRPDEYRFTVVAKRHRE